MNVLEFLCKEWWMMTLSLIGVVVIMNSFLSIITLIINSLLILHTKNVRYLSIKKHGYPLNCNVDGDFKEDIIIDNNDKKKS